MSSVRTWCVWFDEGPVKFIGLRTENSRLRTMEGPEQMVLDAVGLYCFEPNDDTHIVHRRRTDVPTGLQQERVLCKACTDWQANSPAN